MIEGARRLSRQHITIRVPWHDARWTGTVCKAPGANTSCLALTRIAAGKQPSEDADAGRPLIDLDPAARPPCVDERVAFLADHDLIVKKRHPYQLSSPETHGHFALTSYRFEAFSAACIPFAWMLRRQVEGDNGSPGKAEVLRLGYDPAREPELPFATSWIQDKHNQLVMLDTFFGAIEPETSLCLFYAKRTPLADDSRRVIIGAARVNGVSPPTEYEYGGTGGLAGMLWERNVRHSLRPHEDSDGFLMPYHSVLTAAEHNPTIDVSRCVAFAPDDLFESYSYAAEHLRDDGAIASLLACAAALRATAEQCEIDVAAALDWIDTEVARLWTARGIHPGLGSALTAFGLEHGTLLAHEIVRAGADEGHLFDAFAFIDRFVADPAILPQGDRLGFGASFQEKWKALPAERRQLLDLLARCDLQPEQARRLYQPSLRRLSLPTADADILANPYILFERDEAAADRIPFAIIDRGAFPLAAVREAAPLPSPTSMSDAIDRRRVRALIVDLLERAAREEGHTLLPRSWIVRRSLAAPLDPPCTVDEDVVAINRMWLEAVLAPAETGAGEPAYKLLRYAAARAHIAKTVRKRSAGARHDLAADWRGLVDAVLDPLPENPDEQREEERARQEKAGALEVLATSRLAVLVGPAGSGKTTLLRILCDLPAVQAGGILLLAPTGKARVRLEEATERQNQGKTLAQFLQKLKRYDGETGRYFENPDAPREKAYRTVVVDECSMLTEDQLAALLDALDGVERLVLVGDPRQLPPIGAGRPFVDICRHLAPPEQPPVFPRLAAGYAELTVIGRQRGSGRGDVLLARHFSGEPLDPAADAVWDALRAGRLDHVRAVRWPGAASVEAAVIAELIDGLDLTGPEDEASFERSIGGSDYGGRVFFWPARQDGTAEGAAAQAHAWQVLSPIRAGTAGVDGLNLAIQRRFRAGVKGKAEQRWAKIPKPAGPQGLLWGDKVINVRNNGRRSTYPQLENAYVANGDIGIVVGGYKTARMKRRPRDLEVEFSSQRGIKFTYRAWEFTGEDGSPDLELAYALTVHKTQGSQFGQIFLIVPKNCRPLSRELLYTALTRHRDRLVILHEDDVGALRQYCHPAASEIAARMTDLFVEPHPVAIETQTGSRFLDQHLLHRTSRNELVRSKAELAIAEKLIAMDIPYVYEQPLVLDGRQRWPDFTIEDADSGITYYWEHLGLLSDPAYARRWKEKRKAYIAAGVRPLTEGGGGSRILIETTEEDGKGLDMLEVERLAKIVSG